MLRIRIAKANQAALISGEIADRCDPLRYLLVGLSIDDMAARRMIRVEGLVDEDCLVEIDDERITSMCKVHRRTGHASGVTTFISSIGEHNLKLAVFCMKYLKHIGRPFDPNSVLCR